ncbi:MAG: D-alanyl-D-alanine carboxypeptidase [Limnochordales bacterium]|nr:D-alanyl-D-alanine carboxypeptidase [Limnochordales bacterium]
MKIVILRYPSPRRAIASIGGLGLAAFLLTAALTSRSPASLWRSWSFWPWPAAQWFAAGGHLTAADLSYIEGAQQAREPYLSAASAILVDNETGTVLYARNEHTRRAPASTTKILTAILAIESGRLNRTVKVSRRAANVIGSDINLRAGQVVHLEDLLAGLLIRSGNDAAIAIAEAVAGSVEEFAALMNRRAAELGATNSHFVNPHGLDTPDHYTTAYDLALLARTAMNYPLFARLVATRSYSPTSIPGVSWHNTNRLLWSFDGMEGIKTGTTGRAGNCLVAAASRDGRQLISVVMGSENRWGDTSRLLEWGFTNFTLLKPVVRGQKVATVPVTGARKSRVTGPATAPVIATRDLKLTVPVKQANRYHVSLDLQPLTAPVRRGESAGTLYLLLEGKPVASVPLKVGADVPGLSLWERIWQRWRR